MQSLIQQLGAAVGEGGQGGAGSLTPCISNPR